MNLKPRPWPTLIFAGWLLGVSVPLLIGQILAFIGWFRVLLVLALSLGMLPFLAWAYVKEEWLPTPADSSLDHYLQIALWVFAATLWTLIIFPVFLWPRTRLGAFMGGVIAWDVIYYHLPKAVDLIQQRHMWNLAIPYGQYPTGWETLLALSIGIGHSAEGLGPAAGIALFGFLLGFGLLLARETRWPYVLAEVLIGVMVFSFYIPVPNNPWREFGLVVHYASGIGKNDLLAAALILSTLWHLPLSIHPTVRRGNRWGVGLSLATAIAVKPNAGLAASLFLLLTALHIRWPTKRKTWIAWISGGVIGSLWLIRNLMLLGRPFSPIAEILGRRAILYALSKQNFWQPLPKVWLFVTLMVLILGLWAWRYPSWRPAVSGAIMLYGLFLVTPASVTKQHLRVEWRLGLALLAWIWVLLWAGFAQILRSWYRWRIPGLQLGSALLVLLGTGLLLHRYGHHLRLQLEYARILYDPFPQPVDMDTYWSVFDFIHREIRYAAIDFDSAPPFYIYDPDLTNRIARPGFYPAGMPNAVPQPQPDHWLFCSVVWSPKAKVKNPDAVMQKVAAWKEAGFTILYIDSACALARR